MADDGLINELQKLIVNVCNLEEVDITPGDIDPGKSLIGPDSDLGIDSLDAIEIVAAVEKKYGVRINNVNTARMVMKNLNTLADFIRRQTKLNPV